MKKSLSGVVAVNLKNGRVIHAYWVKDCRDVHVTCYDSEFYDSDSTDTSDFMVEIDAKALLKKMIKNKGGQVAD